MENWPTRENYRRMEMNKVKTMRNHSTSSILHRSAFFPSRKDRPISTNRRVYAIFEQILCNVKRKWLNFMTHKCTSMPVFVTLSSICSTVYPGFE